MTKLERAAMQQALEVLKGLKTASSIMNDGPDDSDVNHAACIAAEAWSNASEAIAALREALAEPDTDTMLWDSVEPRKKAEQAEPMTDTELINTNCRYTTPLMAEQAEQEPVAWMFVNDDGECEEIGYGKDYLKGSEMMADFQPLFSAPVHTKDLTDDEIHKLVKQVRFDGMTDKTFQFARAVIAAYKEKQCKRN